MPYKSNAELPMQLKKLPNEAQTIFRKAFNASHAKQGEERARKIAWSAVKKVYERNDKDEWVKKETIQAFVNLDVKLQALSQTEIIARIPQGVFDSIKSKDEHPFFQMYSIAHEGVSSPKIEGKGFKPITWFKGAIQSIKKVFNNGVKFFNGHNSTNQSQDKQELGVVIHAFEEKIDGKLHYCTIGYFPPETREIAKEMDVCSQEAEWNLIQAAGRLIADTCKNVTGIALANSKYQAPAFKDAKRLAYVQAFDNSASAQTNNSEGDSPMTYDDVLKFSNRDVVRKLVADLQLHPNQLFDLKGIQSDREFSKYFEELDQSKKSLEDLYKELEDSKTKNTELDRKIKLNNAKGKLDGLYKELNYTDNIKKFIDKMYDESKDKIEDLSDEGLKKFAEDQKKIYQVAVGNTEQQNDIKLPSGDGSPDLNLESNDYSKPDTNPLLKEAYDPELV